MAVIDVRTDTEGPRGVVSRTFMIRDEFGGSIKVTQGELVEALNRALSEDAMQNLIEDLCD